MAPLSVKRKSLARQVVSRISDLVSARGLKPGDRLPTERQLAADMGVGYGTVREALKTLEAVGIVSRTPKVGTVLQKPDLSLLADVSQFMLMRNGDDLRQLLDARRLIEVNMLDLIVDSATEAQFQRMEFALNGMEAALQAGRIGSEEDIKFHTALLDATNNEFLRQFGSMLQEFFRDQRAQRLVNGNAAKQGLQVHRDIVRSLREKDIQRARKLMNEHLDVYRSRGVV